MVIDFDFHSRRTVVMGTRGMVATSQPLAVAAGLKILAMGANAADAAVAAAAALNVAEPTSTGIGGDCFALYYEAKTGKVASLNASGRSPADLNLKRLEREGFAGGIPQFHPYTITVPGACAGWCDLVEKYGRTDMKSVLAPAIDLAEKGFPVHATTAFSWERGVERQLSRALNGLELTIDGRAPRSGEMFRNPGLARTFRAVAEGGKHEFYRGSIAKAIAAVVHEAGGCLTAEDLAHHTSSWEKPITATYRGFRIWECPPNGQGLAALMGLNILEGFDLLKLPPLSALRLHLQIESMRLAFADARYYICDPSKNAVPVQKLLSKRYASERRALINSAMATTDQVHGVPADSSDTVYLSVVDGEGNACSFINSNYMGFGTGIVPKGFGFTLQNRGHNFSLERGHPNAVAPGKRPYHTIIPALATHASDDRLYACFGVMGGFMQPQGHLQVLSALIDDKLDPQSALDSPRFCITAGSAGGKIALEEGIPLSTMSDLARMGHDIVPVSGEGRTVFGRGQIILRDHESGVLLGGSDPRADGCAMCLL